MTDARVAQALDAALAAALEHDGPVNARLAIYADALRKQLAPFAEGVDRLVARLEDAGAGKTAPQVGEKLPPFLLPDDEGRLVSLDELKSAGPVALAFHRGHWCPYCQINAHAIAEIQGEVEGLGGQIVAITPELQSFTRQHKQAAGARFKILSDISNGYALSLNLAVWVGVEMMALMAEIGRDLQAYQGNASWFLPIPATFVVDRSGIIRSRFVDPDYRRRMDIAEIIAAVRSART